MLQLSSEQKARIIATFKQMEVAKTYANLTIDEAHGHLDPSDHMIISHAITVKTPLISSDSRFPYYRSQGLTLVFNER